MVYRIDTWLVRRIWRRDKDVSVMFYLARRTRSRGCCRDPRPTPWSYESAESWAADEEKMEKI